MSWSPGISNDTASSVERRGFPREALKHSVLLVFFDENNWGKLTDLSENGMSLEFSRPPSIQERVNFTFQAMGCMPVPSNGKVFSESFDAAGKIVWTREFERIAGVQFVDLAEGSREQIRQWLSVEKSNGTFTLGKEAEPEPPVLSREPFAPTALPSETLSNSDMEGPLEEAPPEFAGEPAKEPGSPFAESDFDASTLDDHRMQASEKGAKSRPAERANPMVARLIFTILAGCLAAFAVTAGAKMIMTRMAHRAGAVEHAQDSAAGADDPAAPAAEVHVASAEAARPFHVEVLDASGKRWTLWFAHDVSGSGANEIASKPVATHNFYAPATKATRPRQTVPVEKPRAGGIFALFAPKFSRPASNSSAVNVRAPEAPTIPAEFAVPSQELAGDMLISRAVPAATTKPTGGMVQEARLIRSVPPVYPALARTSRLSGDVVLDALVDARGNVATVKVISGPVLLQQAAVETLRQWKYEPAQLDGKPVAMHLAVTVKFRLN